MVEKGILVFSDLTIEKSKYINNAYDELMKAGVYFDTGGPEDGSVQEPFLDEKLKEARLQIKP